MANVEQSGKTVIGKITAVYGVKGWVKVRSYTDPAENIFDYSPWFLASVGAGSKNMPMVIDDHRVHGKGLVVHIRGIDDRDQAALLCQCLIAVDIGELPALPVGEYYWQQLTGLKVLTSYGGREHEPLLLGRISSLMETGSNDVMNVSPCEGSIDQRERMLPYVDDYVLKVDLEAGTMLVDWEPEF
jgi:16S rRNA processing protein RimM